MANKQLRVSLSQQDAEYLSEIAEKLGVKETDVLRQGLKLMSVYARSEDPRKMSWIIREDDKETELIVL